MTELQPASQSSRKNEIAIAIIGLIGIIVTAGFSNWDKIFPPKNVVQSSYTGYAPTGDPQVELHYFTEITGMRGLLRGMQTEMLGPIKKQIETEYEDKPEIAAELLKVIDEELELQYDQTINVYIPIASKYFSVAELQELNKFYSTPAMREMVRKAPLLNKEFIPVAMTVAAKSEERIQPKVEAILAKYQK